MKIRFWELNIDIIAYQALKTKQLNEPKLTIEE